MVKKIETIKLLIKELKEKAQSFYRQIPLRFRHNQMHPGKNNAKCLFEHRLSLLFHKSKALKPRLDIILETVSNVIAGTGAERNDGLA